MKRNVLLSVLVTILAIITLSACSGLKNKPAHAISFDENTIHHEIQGTGDQTILFIHGWSNTMHVWDAQVAEFSKKILGRHC